MPAPTIVFDLDGTLVDTAPDLVDTLNLIFAREGVAPLPYESARNFVGGGARVMIARGFDAQGCALSPNKLDQLFKDFIAHYSEHLTDRSLPFPGLTEALDLLAATGCRFAVCTNKLEALSVRLLGKLGLADRFAAICGQDTFGMQKPDPEILRRTISAASGRLATTVMIGDSVTDIRTARAAGVPVIAVDFGYNEQPIAEFGPDRIISHFSELPVSVAAISSGSDTGTELWLNSVRLTGRNMLHLHGCTPILATGERPEVARGGTFNMMYRVLMVAGAVLALAACSSSPDWMSFGGLKSGPMLDTVSFESEPPGAEAKTSNGQTCRTPCSLALPVETPLTVTFSLNGYAPESEKLEMIQATGEPPRFGPNPVVVELTPAPQQPRSTKKPAPKKPATKKPAAAAAPAPMTAAPAQPASPWPTSAPPVRQ